MIQNFSHINQIPQCGELIDIAFSKTNRKTPTLIRAKMQIHRIRSFYVRKVKFAAGEITSRLENIVKEFPVLEDMHPFYSELISVLYDRDHYKIALGQVNATRRRIELIASTNTKLLNFGDSYYRCRELKRAALGRMATSLKKLADSFKYLEEVRQHLRRLPSIDPGARTLVICGFPNVGKSSFINAVSQAHVDVQSYAFTTKSIFVGHFDYEDLRWQILDTPGILDRPLADRNSVEMLTVAALAHLRSVVLFFMDLSGTCGHSVDEQISLYESLTPLLDAQVIIVLSKADLYAGEASSDESVARFFAGKRVVEVSVAEGRNIMEARNAACDALLAERIAEKKDQIGSLMHRIKPMIPVVLNEKYESEHLGTNPVMGLHENEGYFSEHKYDIMPEFYNGKNVADFIDAGITQHVETVEQMVSQDELRRFDIMNKDEREMYDLCNNARLTAAMRAHFARRATMPASWKNKVTTSGAIVADLRTAVPVVREVKESHNKKVAKEVKKNYLDMKAKHLFRPRGNKFAN
ncbi:nucleolar GTP-binding protein [Pancytospora philotis]|nr:nucleolar GTP-binding protein [Pancytospora philotis]